MIGRTHTSLCAAEIPSAMDVALYFSELESWGFEESARSDTVIMLGGMDKAETQLR
jgi:hypothetical protein